MADAAALLHREGGFLDVLEDRAEVVLDAAHDEAVEERDGAAGAGACEDAACGQEAEVGEAVVERLAPAGAGALAILDRRGGVRDTPEGIRQRLVAAGFALETVFQPPDLFRDRGQKFRGDLRSVRHLPSSL